MTLVQDIDNNSSTQFIEFKSTPLYKGLQLYNKLGRYKANFKEIVSVNCIICISYFLEH